MKKYRLTDEKLGRIGRTLYKIKSLIDFGNIKVGELGGFIESEDNLSHYGNALVFGDARVYGDAEVFGNARVYEDAGVYGDARVYGNALIKSNKDILFIQNIGSRLKHTTFFKTKDNRISVKCGCFFGTIEEFEEKVKKTHGDNKYAKEYMLAAKMAKLHIIG